MWFVVQGERDKQSRTDNDYLIKVNVQQTIEQQKWTMFLTKEKNKVRQKQVERETLFNLQGDYL